MNSACEMAQSIINLGECDVVQVIGQWDDVAIAVGNGEAICMLQA